MFDEQTYQRLAAESITYLSACLFLWLALSACQPEPHLEWPGDMEDPQRLDEYLKVDQQLIGLKENHHLVDRLDSMLTWTEWLKNYNPNAAYRYAETAYHLATNQRLEKAQGIAAYYMALLNGRQSLYQESLADPMISAEISSRIFMRRDDTDWQIRINNLLGNLWYRQKQIDSSQYYLRKAIQIIDEAPATDIRQALRGEAFHSLGNIEFSKDSIDHATAYFQEAFQLYQETDNQDAMSRLLLDNAYLQGLRREYVVADSLFLESIKLGKTLQDRKQLADAYQRHGYISMRRYRYTREPMHFEKAISYSQEALVYQENNAFESYRQMARTYHLHSSYEADWGEHIDTALVYYKKALESAREEGAIKPFRGIAKAMSSLCDWSADNRNINCDSILKTPIASLLNDNYTVVLDSITNNMQEANTNLITFEKAEQEAIGRLRIRNLRILAGIGLLFAVMVSLVIYLRQQQQRLKMKMQALRAQINPHFMSNSLNAIESLVNLDQKEAASKYLIHFSRLTRRILSSSLNPSTSLSGELETLKHFLALEQLRFRNKLHYQIDVESGLEPDIIEVPSLILQPYIENAIWHGIKPKTEAGLLQIQIRREGKNLCCTVEDDGVGRKRAQEIKSRTVLQRKSVGMKITEQRLQAISRQKGGRVKITDLYDEDGEAAGTRVDIQFPYKVLKNKVA